MNATNSIIITFMNDGFEYRFLYKSTVNEICSSRNLYETPCTSVALMAIGFGYVEIFPENLIYW